MEERKQPKFKWSYILLIILALFMLISVFTNNRNKGQYLTGGEREIQMLVDGEYDNPKTTEKENEQLIEYYYDNSTIYFLVKGSKNTNSFPNSADYYMYYQPGDGTLTKIKEIIAEYNAKYDAVVAELLAGAERYQTIFTKEDSDRTEEEVLFMVEYQEALAFENNYQPIDYKVGLEGTNWLDIIPSLLYLAFGGFMIFMIFRMIGSSNKNAMGFGKSKARAYTASKNRFSDVAGADEEKEELKEIVEFLKNPQKFTNLGARIPKGVLLVGHPGTGKTLLARAVAGEAGVPFITISGSDFVEMFVGVGASRVRDLFDQAKKNKPCIIFIDEIDAVGRQRGAGLGGGNDEREQTLNQLLVEMDGFESNEGIIVLAATNRSDVLDPALMRPGRFDRQIYVNLPDVRGREEILKIHARNKQFADDVDFATLAKITVGFTGADLENMLNEAAILAAREDKPKITMVDITEGINKVTMGPQKKSRLVTEKDRKITAYHEAGHAVLATKLEHTDKVQEVSIIPRGMAGGYTMQRPENDNSYRSYNYLMDEIAVFMGGRIAEEIIFNDITTGASSDISQATKIAKSMVYHYGMSKNLGFLSLDSAGQVFIGRDYQTKNDFSEKLASEADDEVRQILDYNYARATKILKENKDLLEEMTKLLLEQETINKEEVDMLLNGMSANEISALMNERARERKAKEQEIRKAQEIEKKKKLLEDKIREGERLVMAGIITVQEFENIKAKYQQEMMSEEEKEKLAAQVENEIEAAIENKVDNGVSLQEEEEVLEEKEVQEIQEETKVETEDKPDEEDQ